MSKAMIERAHEMLNMNGDERTKAILGKLPVFTQKFKSVDEMENAMTEFMLNTNSPERSNYAKTIKGFYANKEYSKAKAGAEDKLLDKFVEDYVVPYLNTDDLPLLPEFGTYLMELPAIAALNNSDAETFIRENVLENKPEYMRKDLHWLKDVATTVESAAMLSHRVISKSHTINDLNNGISVVAHQVWGVLLTRFRAVYGLQDKPVTRGQIVITINHTMSMLKDLYPELCQNHKDHISDLDTLFEQGSALNATRYINEMFEQNLAEGVRKETTKSDIVSALKKLIETLDNN